VTEQPDNKAALAELDALETRLRGQLEELKQQDPFYFYVPSDGSLTEEAKTFLSTYIRPEDIPVKVDAQLDAHLSTAETIAAFGGNRSGKTTWLIIEAIIHATGEIPDSMKDTYPREKIPKEKYKQLRMEGESDSQLEDVLIPTMRYWVPKKYLLKNSWDESFSSKARKLSLYQHGREMATIKFNSFTQEVSKLQGNKLTGVFYDEEPPRKHREENLMRMATAHRLCERFSMTPTGGMTWVQEDILEKQGPSVKAFKMASVINKHVNLAVLHTIMDKIQGYEAKKMRLLGEFVSLSGLIYGGLFNRQVHVIPPFPVGCTCVQVKENGEHHAKCAWRTYMVVRGADIHTVTPPAMVEVALDPEGSLFVCGVYNPPTCPDIEKIKEDWAHRVEDRGYRVRWSIVDKSLDYELKAAAGINLYKKMIRGANRVRPLYKSEKFSGSIMVGIDELKQLMKVNPATQKPRIFFFDIPELQPLINDIQTLERDVYQDEDKKGQKDAINEGKKHRHAALRYITQRKLTWHGPDEAQYIPADFGEEDSYI